MYAPVCTIINSSLAQTEPHHACCISPDPKCELKFSVLHIKNCRPLIEPSVDHSGSHVRWRVTSLSPVGPVVDDCQPVEHHGAVLVYKALGLKNTFSFRVYLATNNESEITVMDWSAVVEQSSVCVCVCMCACVCSYGILKIALFSCFLPISCLGVAEPTVPCVFQDIRKQVRTAQRRYMKIDKPPFCNLDAKKYQLISVPDGEISPTVCV